MNDKLLSGSLVGFKLPEGSYNNEPLRIKLRPFPKHLRLTCGHKLDTLRLPNSNCPDCWRVFFIKNEDMTKANMKCLLAGKSDLVVKALGSKYYKQLQRFAIFVHETVEAAKEQENVTRSGKEVLQSGE